MPELPEVESTRRGIEREADGRRILELRVYDHRLRWPIEVGMPTLAGQRIVSVGRRAKYLLLRLERGSVILHLGMSGSLRILPSETARLKHDQFDLLLETGLSLRLNDPRRFGSLHYTSLDPEQHSCCALWRPSRWKPRSMPTIYIASRASVAPPSSRC